MMSYLTQYSPLFLRDLERIWAEVFSVSQNLITTNQYINDLMDKIEKYKDYPKSASRLYYEDAWTGYYFITFKAYIIFYHIENNTVFVDRALYGKSDYIQKLNLFNAPNE